MKKSMFRYSVNNGWVSGQFNIFQARNGKITLAMGNGFIQLTEQQVKDLYINVYELEDFSYDDYERAYHWI